HPRRNGRRSLYLFQNQRGKLRGKSRDGFRLVQTKAPQHILNFRVSIDSTVLKVVDPDSLNSICPKRFEDLTVSVCLDWYRIDKDSIEIKKEGVRCGHRIGASVPSVRPLSS